MRNAPIGMIKLWESRERTSKDAANRSISEKLLPVGTKTTISTATGTTTVKSRLKNSDSETTAIK
jgi:hypothetical protein